MLKPNSTIGLDLNGVVINTNAALHAIVCQQLGIKIPPLQFKGRNLIGEEFPSIIAGEPSKEFTADAYEAAKKTFFESPAFFNFAKPLEGAVRAIQQLYADGHTIVLVTDVKNLSEHNVRRLWDRLKLPYCERVFTREDGYVPKAEYYGICHVAVDNDPKHLPPLLGDDNAGDDGTKPYLMLPSRGDVGSAVIIRPDDLDKRIISVSGWKALMAELGYELEDEALAA